MINSMTGFGLSSLIDNKSEVYIEIKGVNHKFLEVTIKLKLPPKPLIQLIQNC